MFKILRKKELNPSVTLMDIEAPLIARKAKAGQFIIFRVDEEGERIPLTIADTNKETGAVTIIFQKVGLSTELLAKKNEGDYILDFVGPLGAPTELDGLKRVAVVGGGNTALEDAEVLAGMAEKVYLVHRRDTFRGDAANVRRLENRENVQFVLDSVPEKLIGENVISGLGVKNVKTGESTVLSVQGVFVAIGQMPDNQAFADLIELDKSGYIQAGEDCVTSAPGIFTAGDCRTKKIRQLTTAAADGAVAALAAAEYVNGLER